MTTMKTKHKILTANFVIGAIGGFISGIYIDDDYDDHNNKWAVGSTCAALGGLSLLAITWLTLSCIQKCKESIWGANNTEYMKSLIDNAYEKGFNDGANAKNAIAQHAMDSIDREYSQHEGEISANAYAYNPDFL